MDPRQKFRTGYMLKNRGLPGEPVQGRKGGGLHGYGGPKRPAPDDWHSWYANELIDRVMHGESPSDVIDEVAPPGWSGTVKAMKKHKDIDNPFALAWSMKNKGAHPHKQPE